MDVLMPQLGETVAEGKITKWFKAAGEAVKPGDNLFEIETDKVSMEVPATAAGTLTDIRFQVGEVAKVGAIVAVIADGAAGTAKAPLTPANAGLGQRAAEHAVADTRSREIGREAGLRPDPQPALHRAMPLDPFFEVRTPARNFGPARLQGGTAVTPLARRLAVERGIDLSQLRGSGPHGRIVAGDVEKAPSSAPAPLGVHLEGPRSDDIKALYAAGSYEEVPLDAMRRTIAARLTQAQAVPHFFLMADVDIGRLIALREEANAAAGNTDASFKLSLNDFLIRAWALALQRVPASNAAWAADRILRFRHADIGVAVALDDGLVAPVLRGVEAKSMSAISAEIRDLTTRAREKKLAPADYQGGSSAISNLGMYGVREFTAIINPPHATILAIGAARRQAVETTDGGVAFASILSVTLSCDHRVIDGALGAKLLAAFKAFVETPVSMLL